MSGSAVSPGYQAQCLAFTFTWNVCGAGGRSLSFFSCTDRSPSGFTLYCHVVPLVPFGGTVATVVATIGALFGSSRRTVTGSPSYASSATVSFAESWPSASSAFSLAASFSPTVAPQSASQAFPTPSKSSSAWSAFGTVRQLSRWSGTPSPSVSGLAGTTARLVQVEPVGQSLCETHVPWSRSQR